MAKTIFQKIIEGEIPADIVHEDDQCVAFRDANPQAPTHILIVPRKPIPSLDDIGDDDEPMIGHLFTVARDVAAEEGLDDGYRTVFNCGAHGGRQLDWPPG